jgi:very-short-patch-repair endonuclease
VVRGLREKVDVIVGRIAARQHGAVKREQLLAAGVTGRMIEERIRMGVLLPVHRGVYLVTYGARSPLADEAAAVLACGPQALLSHVTAGRLLKLEVERPSKIELTVVGRRRKSPKGLRVYWISSITPDELDRHEGIPITSPSLTLLDLAGVLGVEELEGALHEARVQRLVTDHGLRASLAAHPNRRGARALAHLLDHEGGVRVTRSKAERRALRVMREHGLEPDASDFPVGPYRLDFFFQAERVAVEYDSRQFHDNHRRFVGDRRKIAYLAARGIVTVPLTANDLGPGAARAMADLKATLAGRRTVA